MSFEEIRLPDKFSEGSAFGPGFDTRITTLENLAEVRNRRGPESGRRRYDLSRGIAGLDDLNELVEFFIARQGALTGFRLKDWLDYASNTSWTTHRSGDVAVAFGDQPIGTGNGTETQFQLTKQYTSGTKTVTRTITKPVAGTVVVGVNGVNQTSGWSVNTATGLITFGSAVTNGHAVTAGFEFDTPVRFDEGTDRALQVSIQAIETGDLPTIDCVEEIDPAVVSQTRDLGGGSDLGNFSTITQYALSALDGVVILVSPGATGKSLKLPNTAQLPPGGPYFMIRNNGTETIAIVANDGTSVNSAVAINSAVMVFLAIQAAGTKVWYTV